MPGSDPDHWLYRFTVEEWLRAATLELTRAEEALRQKHQRQGVAGARRAAGMAWNAVLATQLDEKYGRSYMEHLKALASDSSVPEAVNRAAASLLGAPLGSDIVQLGPGDVSLAAAARVILDHARERVHPTAAA
jgi:HEPN domain-containing protein